jgi:hypothetical protein
LNDLERAAALDSKTGGDDGARRTLKVAIVTENFLPKIDGVTRTLAMLLEHLQVRFCPSST